MDMVNWKVRLKSKAFWTGLIGALGVAAMAVCQALGADFDAEPWTQALTSVVSGVFGVLALVGVVADPTTEGVSDSAQAMQYEVPRPKSDGE